MTCDLADNSCDASLKKQPTGAFGIFFVSCEEHKQRRRKTVRKSMADGDMQMFFELHNLTGVDQAINANILELWIESDGQLTLNRSMPKDHFTALCKCSRLDVKFWRILSVAGKFLFLSVVKAAARPNTVRSWVPYPIHYEASCGWGLTT